MTGKSEQPPKAPLIRGLSARILALTIVCLLLGEILIFVPSIARFRLVFLEEMISQAHLATLVPASTTTPIDAELEAAMLEQTGMAAITVVSDAPELMLGAMIETDKHFDLADNGTITLIADAFEALFFGGERVIAVMGTPPKAPETKIEVVIDEAPMRMAMIDYAIRILILSLILSAIVGSLIFFALQHLIVRPLGRATSQLAHFRNMPEDESRLPPPSLRQDEIGIVERETARMQRDLRLALAQKTRLAGLGEAVSKLNHDLRNILSTAILISDRLEASDDPAVKSASPRLTIALERALKLCAATLDFAKDRPRPLQLERVGLAQLIENILNDLDISSHDIDVTIEVPPSHRVRADRDELHRVILNLARNAVQAMPDGGEFRVSWRIDDEAQQYVIDVTDKGIGISSAQEQRLFEPFAYSGTSGGSGLGLAIAKEIMKRHGGDLVLLETSPAGTRFALIFPLRAFSKDD